MKIWCCLGCIFGEDKEEVASRSDTVDKDGDVMKEDGVLQNDGSSEGNFGNNNEEEPEEEEEEVVASTRLGLALNNNNNNINNINNFDINMSYNGEEEGGVNGADVAGVEEDELTALTLAPPGIGGGSGGGMVAERREESVPAEFWDAMRNVIAREVREYVGSTFSGFP